MSGKYRLSIEYQHDLEYEDMPFRGNAMSSGDPKVDRETEDWIENELRNGNEAAWCLAHVSAQIYLHTRGVAETYGGVGDQWMGGCSYASERELWESMTLEYDMELDARLYAVKELKRQISYHETDTVANRLLAVVDRLYKDLDRSEERRRLSERQKRAMRVLAHEPVDEGSRRSHEWAKGELVAVDEELEKLG